MVQAPKKRKRKLPKDITSRPDSEVIELIFGKRIKKALDDTVKEIDSKGVPDFMK